MNKCLSIKGAEDILNKPHAFELSTTEDSMFFIAETVKVGSQFSCLKTENIAFLGFLCRA